MRPNRTACDEPRGEFAEGHLRIGLDDLKSPVVDFLFEFGFDELSLPAVGSPGGLLMTHAINIEI